MNKNLEAKYSKIIVHQDSFDEEMDKASLRTFHTLAGECIGNRIYLYSVDNNSICKIDKTTGNIEVEYGDYKKPYCEEYLYLKSVVYQHIICFISDKAESVLKFDTITGKKEWIYFRGNATDFEPFLDESMLILLPIGYSEQLIRINLINNSVTYLPTNYSAQLKRSLQTEQYIYGEPLRIDDWIYRGCYLESYIQKFNIKTGVFEYIAVNNFNRPIRALSFDGDYFWILSKTDGMLVCWNEKNNKIMNSIDLSLESLKKGMIYTTCFYTNGIIFIPEKKGTCILELHVKDNLLEIYDCKQIPGFETKHQESQPFAERIRVGNDGAIHFFPFDSNGTVIKTKIDDVHFYKSKTAKGLDIAADQQMHNESTCTLKSFCKKAETQNESIVNDGNFGAKILLDICQTV